MKLITTTGMTPRSQIHVRSPLNACSFLKLALRRTYTIFFIFVYCSVITNKVNCLNRIIFSCKHDVEKKKWNKKKKTRFKSEWEEFAFLIMMASLIAISAVLHSFITELVISLSLWNKIMRFPNLLSAFVILRKTTMLKLSNVVNGC